MGRLLVRPRPCVSLHGPGGPHRGALLGRRSRSRAPRRGIAVPGAPAAQRLAGDRRAHPGPPHRDRAGRQGRDVLAPRRPRLPRHGRRSEGEPGSPWFLGLASCNEKSHDFGFILDCEGKPGRLHHVAFWVETNHDLTRGAKFLVEHGHDIDFGPGEHGIGEQHYLYFRDPVGLRYELNSGGYRNYVPDWEPAIWRFEDGPNNTYRTEIGMPAVHMAEIPPGIVGRNDEMIEGIIAKG